LNVGDCLLTALLATGRLTLVMIGMLNSIPNLAMGPTSIIPLVPCLVFKSFLRFEVRLLFQVEFGNNILLHSVQVLDRRRRDSTF
jgi:hypothetical protein